MNPRFVEKLRDCFPEHNHPGAADQIIGLIEGTIDPMSYSSVEQWVRSCYHPPRMICQKIKAIDQILGGFGVEAIFGEDANWPDMEYVNFGETYATTIMYDYLKARWRIMSWGDWVEESEAQGRHYS